MKIPDHYIEDLNDIIKRMDTLDAGDLFLAYKQLLIIADMFELLGVSGHDPNYERLYRAKWHVDSLLIKRLAEYEVLKMRVEYYESKS